jgi:predicted ribosome quality control (RQC) complex YloA/Tae2 family protein
MGKHSNIIFRHTDGTIIDSIKHVSAAVSSVREVLPGRSYFIPKAEGKTGLFDDFDVSILCKPIPLQKSLYTTFTGFSPALAQGLCVQSGLDGDRAANTYDESELCKLKQALSDLKKKIEANDFHPAMIVDLRRNSWLASTRRGSRCGRGA